MIERINNEIRSICAVHFKNKAVLLSGISESIVIQDEDKETIYPAIVDDDGDAENVLFDDDFIFGVYHKLNSKTYTQEKGFGDTQAEYCVFEIQLICWGFRNHMRKTAQWVEENVIIPSIPKEAIPMSTDFNSQKVMQQEFKIPIAANQFIFSTKYKYKVRTSCRK